MEQLLIARREGWAELLSGWSPEHHAELAAMLSTLARNFDRDEPADRVVA